MLYSILVAIDVLLAIGIIGLVLIQQGKGADVGAAFGSGASGTVFGARGSASFLTRATAILVTLFFINSLVLAYLASHRPVAESVMDATQQIEEVSDIDGDSEADTPAAVSSEATDIPEVQEIEIDAAPDQDADNTEPTDEISESVPDDVPE